MPTTIAALRRELTESYDPENGVTWEVLGDRYGVNKAVPWRIVNNHYEPRDPEIRARLDLPTPVRLVLLNGTVVHPDAMVMADALQCAKDHCDNWFIPNHPLRKYCPICSPPKK